MEPLFPIIEVAIVLLSVIMQFFIANHHHWSRKKKYSVSISIFLLIFILNVGIHIILGFIPYTPINGLVLIFLIASAVKISVIAGILQMVTATGVWLFRRKINK